MPYPKFEFPANTPAKVANLRNRGEEPRPARDSADSQSLRNGCESCETAANPEHPPAPGFARFAEIRSTFANPANPENADQDSENQGRFANSQNSQGVEPKTQNPSWAYLLAQLDGLAARLVELQAPRLRVDLEGRAVGYRSLEGLDLEGVTRLLGEMLSALARQYPEPRAVQIIALWPGTPSQPVRREVLAELGGEEDCDWF